MRLHRIRVEHVRGLPAAEVHFTLDGVTVVEAPNESGKTSLFDAFDLLLKEKHNTRKQAVKDLQPSGRDVGSVVEAELTVGATHLTVRKCFNKDRSTELRVHAPTPGQFTGDEAHDELRRLLDAGTDMALFEALRFHQGRSLDSVALADSEHLAQKLDASAGGSGDTGDDALYDRIVASFERYHTPTGQEGKVLKEADASLAESEDHVADLAATASELASAGARSSELQRERVRLQDAIATLGPQLEAYRQQRSRLAALRAEVDTAHSRLRAATSERDAAQAAATARQDQIEAIAQTKVRLEQRETVAETARAAWQDQQHRLEALEHELQRAETEEAAARAAVRLARSAVDLGRRRTELQAARERHQRIETALAEAAAADAFLADNPLSEAQLQAIREASDELRVVEARLGDAAPTVRISAAVGLDLLVDGRPVTLDGGETRDHQVPEQLMVALEGTLAVQVRAGASLADRQADRDHARRKLAQACDAVAVQDRAEAEGLGRVRETHLRALEQRDATIERELEGRTREELADQIRRLEAQVAELEQRLRPGGDRPAAVGDGSTAEPLDESANEPMARLPALESAEEAARAATTAVRSEQVALSAEVARLRDIATRASTAASHDRDELASAVARLDDSRARASDAALQEAVTRTTADRHLADQRLAEVQAELDACQPDEVELLAENAQQRQVRLTADLEEVREQAAAVRALIEVRGGQGVGEALQAAEAERDRRAEARRSLRARAAAARALKEAFESARDAAYAAYREPLRERIVQAGRLVFGEDLDVQLDEELAVVSRTLGGVTLGFDRLSAGAREQLAILTALAAADLAGEDGVPLVLDDTLGYTDAARLERLGAVLGRVRGPQVVVLTCVGDRFHAIGGARTVRLREVTTGTS
jgi:hypothetical protein